LHKGRLLAHDIAKSKIKSEMLENPPEDFEVLFIAWANP
jgi:hypothetical protein